MAVIDVEFTTVTFVANTPPTATVAPGWKRVPVMVIAVPPAVGPELGATLVTTVVSAVTVIENARLAVWPPLVTSTVKFDVPTPVGVPVMSPFVAKSRFVGSEPETRAHK